MKKTRKHISSAAVLLLTASVSMSAASFAAESESPETTDLLPAFSTVDLTEKTQTALSLAEGMADAFADGDYKDVSSETPNAEIVLSGDTGTISDSTRGSSGSEVTITSKGIYRVSGSSDSVTIVINDSTHSGNIYLVLDNVSMTNEDAPCIYVESADKVIIQCVGDSSLTFSGSDSASKAAAIYSKDDLCINGSGSLTVESGADGIVCRDDLKITGGTLNVHAEKKGIDAGDSVRIGGGTTSITSGKDGIQIENDEGSSCFYMSEGTLAIDAGYDGIDVGSSTDTFTGSILFAGGEADICSGGGSDNAKSDSASQKSLKCDGIICIGDASVTLSGADDAIHSGSDVYICGGALSASTSDDGIHADASLLILNGSVSISKAYEGMEAQDILIAGGTTDVFASDDGINTAGGSDSASDDADAWGLSEASMGSLIVTDGSLYVSSGGDGLDSNGSLYIAGGTVIVEGPSASGNGALDKGDGPDCTACITGGTVLAIGTADMAINFDSGTQCSALVALSGSAGDTISVDDGSDFSFTVSKPYASIVYSSPDLEAGESYTLTAGESEAVLDFSASLYYSETVGGQRR